LQIAEKCPGVNGEVKVCHLADRVNKAAGGLFWFAGWRGAIQDMEFVVKL
jgi:hypothetical protein